MKYRGVIPAMLLGLTLVALMGLPACVPTGSKAEVVEQAEETTLPVQVAGVEVGDIASVLPYTGNLQPVYRIEVRANFGEEIVTLPVDVGDVVHQGDVLLTFDTTTLEIERNQAQAALSAAEAQLAKMKRGTRPEQILAAQGTLNLAEASLLSVDTASEAQIEAAAGGVVQAQAALKLAQAEYDKVSWADQTGMLPQALALEQATVAYETAMANYNAAVKGAPIERTALESSLLQAQSALALAREPFVTEDFDVAEASVEQARAALQSVQSSLDQATVKSPIDGRVEARYVSPGEAPLAGSPLFSLISDQVEVILAVGEEHIGDVYEGQPAAIRVVAYPNRDFPAVVTSVSPTADSLTHTFTLRVRPEDDDMMLMGGMFADVNLLVEEHSNALLILQSAVLGAEGESGVFVVRDGRAELRHVILGLEQGDHVEVLEGLSEGEHVVVAGQAQLVDGSAVTIDDERRSGRE